MDRRKVWPYFQIHDYFKWNESHTDGEWVNVGWNGGGHHCEVEVYKSRQVQNSGPAILACSEDKRGRLFVYNDEYANQVNYCPFCGKEAQEKL